MVKNQSRRNFLKVAPLAAAAAVPLTGNLLFPTGAQAAEGQLATPVPFPEPFEVFTADKLADSIKTFQAQLGEHYLYQPKALPLTIAIMAHGKQVAKDFEYHEGRDHVFTIIDGVTTFEVGGTPRDARNTKPGEWLASASDGATSVELKKGDMLVIPRGTPHRESTEKSVTWMLISPSGAVKA
jgi:mannose-6-phosphate isomerase-like protein (cupin superfamily)